MAGADTTGRVSQVARRAWPVRWPYGDGAARSEPLPLMYGPDVIALFEEFKNARALPPVSGP